jgi:hypothetical protein
VEEAEKKLKASDALAPSLYEPLLESLREKVEQRTFFNNSGDGVALFLAPGFEAVYFLPVAFEKTCVVGSTFHTRPLLEHIAAPASYWVLAIGEKEVTFWEGTPTGVQTVEIEDLPTNLQDALMLEFEPDDLNFQTGKNYSFGGTKVSGGGNRSLPSPVFHGQGGGRDTHKAYLRQYFSLVSQGIRDYLGSDAQGPLILAAVDYCHPIFREASKLKNLSRDGIEGNVHFWNDKSIYETAWPIARQEIEELREQALSEWERAFGRGAAEMDLHMVGRRTIEGRVHKLLLDKDATLWGHFDRNTGEITLLPEDADAEAKSLAIDVYDDIAETVIQRGGDVVVLSSEEMPFDGPIGAILRGFRGR